MICPNCGKSTGIPSYNGDDYCKALHKQPYINGRQLDGDGAASVWQRLVDREFEEWDIVGGVVIETAAAATPTTWQEALDTLPPRKELTPEQQERLDNLDQYLTSDDA